MGTYANYSDLRLPNRCFHHLLSSLFTPFLISRYEPNLEIKIEDLITDSNGSTNQRKNEQITRTNDLARKTTMCSPMIQPKRKRHGFTKTKILSHDIKRRLIETPSND